MSRNVCYCVVVMSKHVAIVGATGAVGQELLNILEARNFPVASLTCLASARSAGSTVLFKGEPHTVRELKVDSFAGVDVAFFSAGGSISKEFAPPAVKAGAIVIDNTSAFRMKDGIPLVVPEVNADAIKSHVGLIANPNCSTIILAVALWPLHQAFRVKRVVASTYQAVSGAGAKGLAELEKQMRNWSADQPVVAELFPHPIVNNLFSHNSPIDETGYNEEERKLVRETHKIFGTDRIGITATCIRVPVPRAHSESLNIEFERSCTPDDIRRILSRAPGVKLVDDPTPLAASGQDDVLVGRVRQDVSISNGRGIDLFLCGDQIRKGAATNAVQIAEKL